MKKKFIVIQTKEYSQEVSQIFLVEANTLHDAITEVHEYGYIHGGFSVDDVDLDKDGIFRYFHL